MKFLALVATARAAIHADCTDTWKDAKDTACDGAGEQCFDWQKEDKSSSMGLFCGKASDCNTVFKWSDGTTENSYYAECTGLSMADCSGDKKDSCDKLGNFQCADWTDATNSVTTIGCAQKKECGGKHNDRTVTCTGLVGDDCKTDAECDQAAKYKCGVEFNNQTYAFVKDAKPKCAAPASCGAKAGTDNNTILLCYGMPGTACGSNKTCDKPDGDSGDVICGYLAPGDMSKNVTSFCVDKTWCPPASLNGTGANVTYFGAPTKLWCGSARTALAMGAAAISAYLAM